jgi:hypothetical protein
METKTTSAPKHKIKLDPCYKGIKGTIPVKPYGFFIVTITGWFAVAAYNYAMLEDLNDPSVIVKHKYRSTA